MRRSLRRPRRRSPSPLTCHAYRATAPRPARHRFSEHQKQFEVEKVTRLQREAQVLKRVGDEVFRLQQKVTAERSGREAAIALMKDDFAAAHKAREKVPPPDGPPRRR